MTIEKLRIIGHPLFDGSFNYGKGYYNIKYINSSPKLIKQFINDVKLVYGLEKYEIFEKKIYIF